MSTLEQKGMVEARRFDRRRSTGYAEPQFWRDPQGTIDIRQTGQNLVQSVFQGVQRIRLSGRDQIVGETERQ